MNLITPSATPASSTPRTAEYNPETAKIALPNIHTTQSPVNQTAPLSREQTEAISSPTQTSRRLASTTSRTSAAEEQAHLHRKHRRETATSKEYHPAVRQSIPTRPNLIRYVRYNEMPVPAPALKPRKNRTPAVKPPSRPENAVFAPSPGLDIFLQIREKCVTHPPLPASIRVKTPKRGSTSSPPPKPESVKSPDFSGIWLFFCAGTGRPLLTASRTVHLTARIGSKNKWSCFMIMKHNREGDRPRPDCCTPDRLAPPLLTAA